MTISHGRENIDLPIYEGEMESTVRSIHEDVSEDETDPLKSEHDKENLHNVAKNGEFEEKESNDDQNESHRKGNRENNSKKRSHPQVCPPGWLSPWDYVGNSNSGGCGGCGCGCGNCGSNGDFGGVGAADELDAAGCGCGEYGCGGGCCCGCGGCGCKFHGGGFMHHNGYGRRSPRLFNDGHIQHVWLRDGRMRRNIPSPLTIRRNILR
ncbi:hypothetical protein ACROYT_G006685 [Oculina patagonica]